MGGSSCEDAQGSFVPEVDSIVRPSIDVPIAGYVSWAFGMKEIHFEVAAFDKGGDFVTGHVIVDQQGFARDLINPSAAGHIRKLD